MALPQRIVAQKNQECSKPHKSHISVSSTKNYEKICVRTRAPYQPDTLFLIDRIWCSDDHVDVAQLGFQIAKTTPVAFNLNANPWESQTCLHEIPQDLQLPGRRISHHLASRQTEHAEFERVFMINSFWMKYGKIYLKIWHGQIVTIHGKCFEAYAPSKPSRKPLGITMVDWNPHNNNLHQVEMTRIHISKGGRFGTWNRLVVTGSGF